MKDEALSPMGFKMEHLPIATFADDVLEEVRNHVTSLIAKASVQQDIAARISDWLRHAFAVDKFTCTLSTLAGLDGDAFVATVREVLPKKHKLTAADIAELKREHAETIQPARLVRAEILSLERRLSDLVNQAYGLTPEEIDLMWRTAPPRMPFTPAGLAVEDAISDGEI